MIGQHIVMLPATRLSIRSKLALCGEILRAYVRVRWWLFRRGLPDTLAALRDPHARASTDALDDRDQQIVGLRLARAAGRVLDLLPSDARCLTRSLVVTDLLGKRGIECSLVIGVKPGSGFAAHAWVETKGLAVLPPNEPEFTRLVEL